MGHAPSQCEDQKQDQNQQRRTEAGHQEQQGGSQETTRWDNRFIFVVLYSFFYLQFSHDATFQPSGPGLEPERRGRTRTTSKQGRILQTVSNAVSYLNNLLFLGFSSFR